MASKMSQEDINKQLEACGITGDSSVVKYFEKRVNATNEERLWCRICKMLDTPHNGYSIKSGVPYTAMKKHLWNNHHEHLLNGFLKVDGTIYKLGKANNADEKTQQAKLAFIEKLDAMNAKAKRLADSALAVEQQLKNLREEDKNRKLKKATAAATTTSNHN